MSLEKGVRVSISRCLVYYIIAAQVSSDQEKATLVLKYKLTQLKVFFSRFLNILFSFGLQGLPTKKMCQIKILCRKSTKVFMYCILFEYLLTP